MTVNVIDGAPRSVTLLQRLASREHREATALFAEGGVAALVTFAAERLDVVTTRRRELEALVRELAETKERSPRARAAVARYLEATVTDRLAREDDLRALRKGRPGILDEAALAERVARACAHEELRAEVALSVAIESGSVDWVDVDFDRLLHLARAPGRWSRRTEAGALLVRIAGSEQGRRHLDRFRSAGEALSARSEHRWVQPVGIALLAATDRTLARARIDERLRRPGDGEDFLVRERIVELVGQGVCGDAGDLLAMAAVDPSDHVRLAVTRAERDPERLRALLLEDQSPKVRASTAITLARRLGNQVETMLASALETERDGFVVTVLAEELAALVAKGRADGPAKILTALGRTALRPELPVAVRARLAEITTEVAVVSSPLLRPVHELLRGIIERTPVPGRTKLVGPALAAMSDDDLGRVLTVLATGDFPLGLDRDGASATLYRGEPRTFSLWRALFEMRHPTPSKRQAFVHTWSRQPQGMLRAPPGGLAELTATQVPGERVLVEAAGGWGRHLPLVEDFVSLRLWSKHPIRLVSALGTTILEPPRFFGQRLAAWAHLTRRYADLVELRRRALGSEEAGARAAYIAEVERSTGIGVTFTPHRFATGKAVVTLPVPDDLPLLDDPAVPSGSSGPIVQGVFGVAALAPLATSATTGGGGASASPLAELVTRFPGLSERARELLLYAGSSHGNRLPELAAYAGVMLAGMMARSLYTRRGIDRDRAALPLVIGGWGTRGKSGTERLKAGLFQGLGHETLVKTTGCEAMFIHAMPGVPAREIFLYRPYDKATVWEQREVLSLGRRFGARVFLWECMALQPDLVNLLQAQWMRDDYSTITNAYPDHEDVQGPTGVDVATCISEFVPTKGNLFTTEDQMLPILRERAKERGTSIREVPARDADLVADDLLARFPYQEHPKNIALVTALARSLGIPWSIAIAEMADHVVPDLGVLKTYPDVPYAGRILSFTNGMSANERTGAMANWRRSGFDEHDADREPGRWIVTVVNNRADRIARSEVFARFVVEDIGAHVHVLIGTNVSGLVGFIAEALERHLLTLRPTAELSGSGDEQLRLARTRLDRAFAALKIGRPDAESAKRELDALRLGPLDPPMIAQLVAPARPEESYAQARQAINAALPPWIEGEARPFVVRILARRRVVRAIQLACEQHVGSDPALVDRLFTDAYRTMFNESIVALADSGLSGDEVVDKVAHAVPPGARASIHGLQNIKGTGLDFVYRWVSLGEVHKALLQLHAASRDRAQREEALRTLLFHDDYGLVDAAHALGEVERVRAKDTAAAELPYEPTVHKLRTLVETRRAALEASAGGTTSAGERVKGALKRFIGVTFDAFDSMRRQRMARELIAELIAGRISHATAALGMRDIVARSKGGWLK